MIIYFKNMNGDSLVEKGEILAIGGPKKDCILTGNDKNSLIMLGSYKNEEEAKEVFEAIVEKIVNPNLLEAQKGIIYIDLEHLSRLMEEEK